MASLSIFQIISAVEKGQLFFMLSVRDCATSGDKLARPLHDSFAISVAGFFQYRYFLHYEVGCFGPFR